MPKSISATPAPTLLRPKERDWIRMQVDREAGLLAGEVFSSLLPEIEAPHASGHARMNLQVDLYFHAGRIEIRSSCPHTLLQKRQATRGSKCIDLASPSIPFTDLEEVPGHLRMPAEDASDKVNRPQTFKSTADLCKACGKPHIIYTPNHKFCKACQNQLNGYAGTTRLPRINQIRAANHLPALSKLP